MDFWPSYQTASKKADFGSARFLLNTCDRLMAVDRHDTSQSTVDGKAKEIQANELTTLKLGQGNRYVTAKEITFDLLLSFYDVNSFDMMVLRATMPLGRAEIGRVRSFVGRLRRPNIEIRAIGLQNGDEAFVKSIDEARKATKGKLVEVDLFGTETRYIALDTKTGMSYNLLFMNRIFRPGERVTAVKKEDFEARRSKLKFV